MLTKIEPEDAIREILQQVNDAPPWIYEYKTRPTDLLEIRACELEDILRFVLCPTQERH